MRHHPRFLEELMLPVLLPHMLKPALMIRDLLWVVAVDVVEVDREPHSNRERVDL